MLRIAIVIFIIKGTSTAFSQPCMSTVIVVLENTRGGFHSKQPVTLVSKVDGKRFTQRADERGKAILAVPCSEMYIIEIPNYTKKPELESPPLSGMTTTTLSYPPDMVEKMKLTAMNENEKHALDEVAFKFPDTTFIKGSIMVSPKPDAYYSLVILSLRDIKGVPLTNEKVMYTGRTRGKTVTGVTDKNGRLIAYLPKGDMYDINFKYHRQYNSTECPYSKGMSQQTLSFSYIGTREVEKRREEERNRILMEEKREREERARFEKYCKDLGITLEEGHRREALRIMMEEAGSSDSVVSTVLRRNVWPEKLMVCDVTGSMTPYAAQFALWYRLNYLKEKNLQFVLFNDGNNIADEQKKIGETGGVYYAKSISIDSLDHLLSYVRTMGSGGDLPENNMEALIQGTRSAVSYKELIMVADNRAPVKDISLLKNFSKPVHVIVCGASDGKVHPDYLLIAWKTKGTLHTMEQDITNLARLSEGQIVKIGLTTYRIMGGEFIDISR